MIRPSILILVDDLVAPTPVKFQWLLHAFEKFDVDGSGQTITSSRGGATLIVRLLASTDLSLSQIDDWPIEPDKGYPSLTRPLPPKRWHFTAETDRTDSCRIAALFSVQGPGEEAPNLDISRDGNRVSFEFEVSEATYAGEINLSPEATSLIRVDVNGEPDVRITAR